ncbi:WD40-repeat-containing domain protein [Dipodascopsis uninucleata]
MSTALSREVVCSFKPSKIFRPHKENTKITTLDFDDTGNYLLSSGEDESLQLFDSRAGKHNKTLYSKKYGVHLAKFTHNSMNCVYVSTKENDTLRYLSLHDNHYIRYFKGHKKRVIDLQMSPSDDQMISSSLDGTVRVWDIRSSICHGLLSIPSPAWIAFDPAGVVFAVACEQTAEILLYDLRNYDSEPFGVFKIDALRPPNSVPWSKVEFSNDGKHILISTRGTAHYLLDAFSGDLVMRFSAHNYAPVSSERKYTSSGDTCFSPDGRFVFSGSDDKKLYIYDTQSPVRDGYQRPIAALDTNNTVPSNVLFNPRSMMLASADKEIIFWLPDQAIAERNIK